jgi:myosin-6
MRLHTRYFETLAIVNKDAFSFLVFQCIHFTVHITVTVKPTIHSHFNFSATVSSSINSAKLQYVIMLLDEALVWYKVENNKINQNSDLFDLCKVTDITRSGITLTNVETNLQISASYVNVFPASDNLPVDDCCRLKALNIANILKNLKSRYDNDNIYTYVANILIAVNPFTQVPNLYENPSTYHNKSIGSLEPHIYAIAENAFTKMVHTKTNQSILISGESGAGKTENTKFLVNYLVDRDGENKSKSINYELIRSMQPLIETFGNAKTSRNNNSSRFGKFLQMNYADQGKKNSKMKIKSVEIKTFLFERSRTKIKSHRDVQSEERTFHIFYQLLANKKQFPDSYKLNRDFNLTGKNPEFLKDTIVNDERNFQETLNTLANIKVDRDQVFQILSGILHLSNIEFSDDLTSENYSKMDSVKIAAVLLGLSVEGLITALTTKVTIAGREQMLSNLSKVQSENARDALIIAIYKHLFDYLIENINSTMSGQEKDSSMSKLSLTNSKTLEKSNFIGVLDMAGFETFPTNSFEQLCINYSNEHMQLFFNQNVILNETQLYKKEGLTVGTIEIEIPDLQKTISLIETQIFPILSEQDRLPNGSDDNFFKNLPKTTKKFRSFTEFTIEHFAGNVAYDSSNFTKKNNDSLHPSMVLTMKNSSHSILKNFDSILQDSSRKNSLRKLTQKTVSTKFQEQLVLLITKLKSSNASFVRCIKSNDAQEKMQFLERKVYNQLLFSGVEGAITVLCQGFPNRVCYEDLPKVESLSKYPRQLVMKALLKKLGGFNANDFTFGVSKVFFKNGTYQKFDKMMSKMNNGEGNIDSIKNEVVREIVTMRWKKYIFAVRVFGAFKKDLTNRRKILNNAALKIQSVWRGFKARQKYKEKLVKTVRRRVIDQVRKLEWLSDADKKDSVGKLEKMMKVEQIEAVFGELKEKAKCNYSRILEGSIAFNNLLMFPILTYFDLF